MIGRQYDHRIFEFGGVCEAGFGVMEAPCEAVRKDVPMNVSESIDTAQQEVWIVYSVSCSSQVLSTVSRVRISSLFLAVANLHGGGTITKVRPDDSSVSAPERLDGSVWSRSISEAIKEIIDSVFPSPIGSATIPP